MVIMNAQTEYDWDSEIRTRVCVDLDRKELALIVVDKLPSRMVTILRN